MDWEEINRIIHKRIIELTRAQKIKITKNFSKHLAFKEVISQELIEGDRDYPSYMRCKLEDGKTYSPFYRMHYMGIAYKENSCEIFEYKAYAIGYEGLTLTQENYNPILKNMDSHLFDIENGFGRVNSPIIVLTSHVFVKDNSFYAFTYNKNRIIKREFEGKIGSIKYEDKDRILYTIKGNQIYRYKINTGKIDDHREYVGYFELEDKELYHTDEKEIESIECDPISSTDSRLKKMRAMIITFTDGTKRVLADAPKKEKTVSGYYKDIKISSYTISLSQEEKKQPENAKYKPKRDYDIEGYEAYYYIPGLLVQYETDDSKGVITITPDCTQKIKQVISEPVEEKIDYTEELNTSQEENQSPKQKAKRKAQRMPRRQVTKEYLESLDTPFDVQ